MFVGVVVLGCSFVVGGFRSGGSCCSRIVVSCLFRSRCRSLGFAGNLAGSAGSLDSGVVLVVLDSSSLGSAVEGSVVVLGVEAWVCYCSFQRWSYSRVVPVGVELYSIRRVCYSASVQPARAQRVCRKSLPSVKPHRTISLHNLKTCLKLFAGVGGSTYAGRASGLYPRLYAIAGAALDTSIRVLAGLSFQKTVESYALLCSPSHTQLFLVTRRPRAYVIPALESLQ